MTITKKSGFTLIETVLAIAVIGMVITAAASLTRSSLRMGYETMHRFTAFHLAEEGVEVVRHLRDSNWLQNRAWRRGLEDGMYEITELVENGVQDQHFALTKLSGAPTSPNLVLSEGEKFTRVIEIVTIAAGKDPKGAIRVTSRVNYTELSGVRDVSLSADFTDWKKGPL
ncbi:MAG: prepilin-type N-terminal cleavage/methylation domain-containing protein [Patescibacteria group bacterium]